MATGVALAILSALAVRTEAAARTPTVVPVKNLKIHRPLYRMQLKRARPGPSLEAFLRLLGEPA